MSKGRDWKPTRDSIVCSCGSKNITSQVEGLESGRYLCLDCGFECIADLSSGRLVWVDPATNKELGR